MDWEKNPRSEWQLLAALAAETGDAARAEEARAEEARAEARPHGPAELLTLQHLATAGFVIERSGRWTITEQGRSHLDEAPSPLLWNGAAQVSS